MPDSAHIYDLTVAKALLEINENSVGLDCCEQFYSLASTTSAASEFNDLFLAVDRKASVSDSFSFEIKKCGSSTVLPNLGTVLAFPQDDLAIGIVYDLRQYLATYGAGNYIISKVFTFLGSVQESVYAKIRVWEYTEELAHRTFRLKSYFNNKSNVNGTFIDFTGSGAHSTIRLNGKFGGWQAQTESKVLIDHAYNSVNTATTNKNKYTLTVNPVSYLFTKRLIKLHLLCGTSHMVTDHNYNHRKYTDFPVTYITETLTQEEPAVEQLITAEFSEETVNEFSRHNGI